MIDNVTVFKMELEIAAQKVIHNFMVNNQEVEAQIQKAVESAVKNFDFEREVEQIVQAQLRSALRDAMSYSKLQELVKAKTEKIYNELIEKEFSKFTN